MYFGIAEGLGDKDCFVCTVGTNEAIVRRDFRYQGQQDTSQAQVEF
jgi:hypothetical protein